MKVSLVLFRLRRLIMVTTLAASIVVPATPGVADEQTVRSGTIVSGPVSGLGGGYPLACDMVADCRAWLASECDPALTGSNPALSASIVDVGDIADPETVWVFEHSTGAAAAATLQLWQQDCTEIGPRVHPDQGRAPLRIPSTARWMTVTGYTYNPWATWPPVPNAMAPLPLEWTLKGYQRSESPPAPSSDDPPQPEPSPGAGSERSTLLDLRGHLRAVGKIVSSERACTVGVPIVVQRRGSTGWIEAGSGSTNDDGGFTIRMTDRPDRYRAVATEIRSPEGQLCPEAGSAAQRHRH